MSVTGARIRTVLAERIAPIRSGRIEALQATEPALDGIRAVAVLSVLFVHFQIPGFSGGFFGVDAFFVLSGYLITRVIYTGKIKGRDLSYFYWHRLVRLFPVLLIVCLSLSLIPRTSLPADILLKDRVATLTYISNWTRALPGGTGTYRPLYTAHTWSLSIEEQFYIVWPILFLYIFGIGQNVSKMITALITGCSFLWLLYAYKHFAQNRIYNGFDTHSGGMLLGCLLAQIGRIKIPSIVVILASAIYIYIVVSALRGPFGFIAAWVSTAVVISHVVEADESKIKRFLSMRPAVYLGKISYSLYLWHFVVALRENQLGWKWSIGGAMLGMFLSFALAALTYHFVEIPCRLARDRLSPLYMKVLGYSAAIYAVGGMLFGVVFFWFDDIFSF